MVTRRKVLGAGLAIVSVSGAIGLNSPSRRRVVKDQTGLPELGALMLDERLGVSKTLVAHLRNRNPGLPFLTIRLDSPALTKLKQVFERSQMVAGISCGATLFCLERIAWDHGYRIARRSEHEFNAKVARTSENNATVLALADAIIANRPESSTAISLAGRTYRPSGRDHTLHAWVMQRAAAPKRSATRQENRG
jgi:hypothetical protein